MSSLPQDEAAVNAAFTMTPCTLETSPMETSPLETSSDMAEFQAEVHAEA